MLYFTLCLLILYVKILITHYMANQSVVKTCPNHLDEVDLAELDTYLGTYIYYNIR